MKIALRTLNKLIFNKCPKIVSVKNLTNEFIFISST